MLRPVPLRGTSPAPCPRREPAEPRPFGRWTFESLFCASMVSRCCWTSERRSNEGAKLFIVSAGDSGVHHLRRSLVVLTNLGEGTWRKTAGCSTYRQNGTGAAAWIHYRYC